MFAGLISVAEATVPPIPKGIFSMHPAETNGFPDQILNDPRIVGLDLGDQWPDIEGTEGVYDWSSVDSELVKAEAHGKKVLLRIVSGGINVPGWLLADPNKEAFPQRHLCRLAEQLLPTRNASAQALQSQPR